LFQIQKQTKPQKPKKVENDIDINNIDAMFEDMKNLVLNNENTTDTIDDVEEKENLKESSFDINLIAEKTTLIETEKQETNDIVETLNENEETVDEVVSINEEDEIQQVEEKQTEELVQEEEIKEEPKKENKSKRMTYEEMFGHTWMGYGFSC